MMGKDKLEKIMNYVITPQRSAMEKELVERLKAAGCEVKPQYKFPNSQARVDILAIKEGVKYFVEVKENCVTPHILAQGLGQLLFYHFLDPKPRLYLATSDYVDLTRIPIEFFTTYNIKLLLRMKDGNWKELP